MTWKLVTDSSYHITLPFFAEISEGYSRKGVANLPTALDSAIHKRGGSSPMTFDARTLTEARYERRVERAANNGGCGATDGSLAIINRYLEVVTEAISKRLTETNYKGKEDEAKLVAIITKIDPYVLALCGLQTVLSSVAKCDSLSQTLFALGFALEREVYAYSLQQFDGKLAQRIEHTARKRNGSLKARRAAVRKMAKTEGFKIKGWTPAERLVGGNWLVSSVLECDAFVLCEDDEGRRFVTITEEAMAISDTMVRQLMERHPVYLPSLTEPAPWTDTTMDIQGYETFLIRKRDKVTQGTVKAAIRAGQMDRVLEAVNAAQSVSYRVNEALLEVVVACQEKGIHVPGLPPLHDVDPPARTKAWEDMTKDERKAWRKEAAKVAEINRSYIGQRLVFDADIQTAKWLAENGNRFWTPINMDYRGRIYGIPSFNFQRQDYVRALFLFSEGKPLGADGLYWLKVHLANCGDFGKVSKRTFDERVAWVDANIDLVWDYAIRPLDETGWTQADKPFLFLAACMELVNAISSDPHTYVCALPCSWDGSCSGLQHLSAMTRAEEGALVNLTPSDLPQDVYQVVADVAREKVQGHLDDAQLGEVAQRALAYGVNRSLVKRNVMTYSYSSKRFGMAQQLMEDTMKPLSDSVLKGELEAHPFGEDGGYNASRYLAAVTYESIEQVVSKPAEAMRYLQGIARALAHEGKPTIWQTPLGLPVVLRYPVQNVRQVKLWLHDRGARIAVQPRYNAEGKGIDKAKSANGIAPSFVHSMDACHLQMVILASKSEGINNVALVHDSFGALPADCSRFREIIKEQFFSMYDQHDVLEEIRAEAFKQSHTNNTRIPDAPAKGNLDLAKVLDAEYAFA